MAEGKYGPLRPVSIQYFPSDMETPPVIVPLPARWGDDEPLFLLRSQDALAVPTLKTYAVLAAQAGRDDLVTTIDSVIKQVARWQERNRERVKLAD